MTDTAVPITTKKDWSTDQEVRWCPGCGDYSILTAVQMLLPELGVRRENTVFVSGIGCSSRFPYYMNTYGVHSIHGRAPALATGVAIARPDLDVWVVTGDGDALSIGGNHLIHMLRRNVNLTMLLFNNQIYGLTKGQYSPTSEVGKVTKSTPYGSLDTPFNPVSLALGAEATFVARTHDLDRKHMMETIRRAHEHKGASFVEIYQNCNVFNDGAFEAITGKEVRPDMLIPLVHGERIRFGAEGSVAPGPAGETGGAGGGLAAGDRGQAVTDLVDARLGLGQVPLLDGRQPVVAQADLGEGGELVGEDEGPGERPAGLGDAVDEAHRPRLVGADAPSGEDQVHRPAVADEAGQPDRAEVDEGDAEAAAVHAERGVSGGDPQVAPQRHLQPTGDGVPFDGGQHGLGQPQPGGPHRTVAVLGDSVPGPGGHRLQIGAGAERAPAPGQHGDRR